MPSVRKKVNLFQKFSKFWNILSTFSLSTSPEIAYVKWECLMFFFSTDFMYAKKWKMLLIPSFLMAAFKKVSIFWWLLAVHWFTICLPPTKMFLTSFCISHSIIIIKKSIYSSTFIFSREFFLSLEAYNKHLAPSRFKVLSSDAFFPLTLFLSCR